MQNKVKNTVKLQSAPYKTEKTVHDFIPFDVIFPDGMMKSGQLYSMTFRFTDINYAVLSQNEKEASFEKYMELLSSLDDKSTYKITIIRHREKRKRSLIIKKDDGLDYLRSDFILQRGEEDDVSKNMYITVSTALRKSDDDARAYFTAQRQMLERCFLKMGSVLSPLDADGKLKLLHDIFRDDEYSFSLEDAVYYGENFKDSICPNSARLGADFISFDDRKYLSVLYLKDYASYIKDTVLNDIISASDDIILSVDIVPEAMDESLRTLEKRLLGVETNITNYMKRHQRQAGFDMTIPYDMEIQRTQTRKFLDDLKSRDMRMMFGLITVCPIENSREKLMSTTDKIKQGASAAMCQASVLKYQMRDAFFTCVPFGLLRLDSMRTLTSEAMAAFMPFHVLDMQQSGGVYLGKNTISGRSILCNKENLINQSAFILGVPGSGKSMAAKSMIAQTILFTDDDVLICDPEGEYASMIDAMAPPSASVVRISQSSGETVNAMDIPPGDMDKSALSVKSEFIMSLVERIDPSAVGPKHKSIIDRCVMLTYSYASRNGIVPTLHHLRACLMEQSEKEAKDIALALELYTDGSFDMFSKETNVKLNERIVVFDIHSVAEQMKGAALLVMCDAILNRVMINHKRGRKTHIFIDEFHVLYENEYSASFFASAYRQFRKRNASPCAITQNVEYILSTVASSTMLSNSEFIIMLCQSAKDREMLENLLSLPKNVMSALDNASCGTGLIKFGPDLIPFDNTIDKDSEIYKLMSTRPGEGVFN